MILNNTLNLFIGLSLTFGCMALVVSALTEALSAVCDWRARTLVRGVKQLLNDPTLSNLGLRVLNHAAVNPLSLGATPAGQALTVRPSYIEPMAFAAALLDTLHTAAPASAAGTPPTLLAGMRAVPDTQIRTFLVGVHTRANGDLATMRGELATWFDASMEQVSGRYKRDALVVSFALGLVLAGVMNVDAARIAHVLWSHGDIAAKLTFTLPDSIRPEQRYNALLDQWLTSFPYGWVQPFSWFSVIGWLGTATATLFGAPFWFDTLQRFTNVRATGDAPDRRPRY